MGDAKDSCPVSNSSYLTLSTVETNQLLVGWFDMTRGFVHAVMNKAPFELITKYVNGDKKFDSTEDVVDLVKAEGGFLACFVFAMIFILAMMVSCLCVCSCRCCCGKCGGGNYQRKAKNVRCRRQIYMVWLFVCLVLISIGLACSILSVDQGFKTVDKGHDTVLGVLDNAKTFTSDTLEDVSCLMTSGVDETIDKTRIRMNDIKIRDGEPLKEKFANRLKALEITSVDIDRKTGDLKSLFDNLKSSLNDMNKDASDPKSNAALKIDVEKLKNDLDQLRSDCGELCKDLNTTLLEIIFPSGQTEASLEDDQIKINQINLIKFQPQYDKAIQRVRNIPNDVFEKSKDQRREIDGELTKIQNSVKGDNEILNSLENFKDSMNTVYRDAKDIISKNLNGSSEYTDYGAITNMSMKFNLLLIVVPTLLWFLGLICGILGHGDEHYAKANRRGCLSNCGGVMLMAGAYLFFVFSVLTMLVLCPTFQVGGHAQVYVCQPLMEDGYDSFDDFYAKAAKKFDNNITKRLRPSRIIKKCKDDETIVSALNLKDDVEMELNKFLDLANETNIENFKNREYFDFGNFLVEFEDFRKLVLGQQLDNIADLLEATKAILTSLNNLDKTNATIEQVLAKKDLEDKHRLRLEELKKQLEDFKEDLGKSAWYDTFTLAFNIARTVVEVKTEIEQGVDIPKLRDDLKNVLSKAIDDYVNDVLSPGKEYVQSVINRVNTDIARCGILYKTFDLGRNVLCSHLLDPFNGYWFGIGWCLFFEFFALIAAIKLSKHFYRMSKIDKLQQAVEYVADEARETMSYGGSRQQMVYPMKERGYDNGGFREQRYR